MAKITQYTRETMPQSVNQGRQATAADFGGNQTGLMAQADAAQDIAQAIGQAGETINKIEVKRANRIETINRVREAEQFYNEAFEEFNRTQTEGDLVNPATADEFNKKLREKAAVFITNHTGSEESRAVLESKILSAQGDFSRQMTSNSLLAQRKFIMDKAGGAINALSNKVRDNPRLLGDVMKEADAVISEFSSALYPEDEIDLIAAAQEQIAVNAIYSYTDSGQYEDAKALINENPFFIKSLNPDSQRRILTEIDRGIREKDQKTREIKNNITAIRTAAEELGVEISGPAVFSAVTGVTNAQTPQAKIDEFARATNTTTEKLTPSIIAKIGFGVDLPAASEIDYNKEFTPSGDMTPKGIGGKVKPNFDRAAAVKTYKDKIDGAIGLFRADGNTQALLSAMITFQKALDDGAVVREGDIVLQRSAQGLSAQIGGFLKQLESGQVVGDALVTQMQSTMENFATNALMSEKAMIDPLLDEADRLGYRRVNIIPDSSYNAVFGNIKNPEKEKEQKSLSDKPTITMDEFLKQ
jgi:hypothetical protein